MYRSVSLLPRRGGRSGPRCLHAPATETAANPRDSSEEALWQEAEPAVEKGEGLLILDDTTLDKPYANEIEHAGGHWSGKHGEVVKGINLLTLLWRGSSEEPPSEETAQLRSESSSEEEDSEEEREPHVPCDFRFYEKDGKTKNKHFREMALTASDRGFDPEYVVFDSWYSGLDNLKKIRDLGWKFFTRLEKNRKMGPDDTYNQQIREIDVPEEGRKVHLKGFGFVKVPQAVSTNGDAEEEESEEKKVQYWATNDLEMTEENREELARRAWGVETYHRRLKQYCGAEKSQCQSAEAQHNHIQMSIRAFLRLELHRVETAISFYESKTAIIREAIRAYLADPTHVLPSSA